MRIPNNLFYSTEHLWTKVDADGNWQAGITDYAQDLLGDIVFVDAPAVGTAINAGQACGLVESVKTGSDLHAPISGEIVEINDAVINSPESINDKPYDAWIFKFKAIEADPARNLLTAEAYQTLLSGL
jgi:glycine cleavage system H protein